jgi:hypothetical protein
MDVSEKPVASMTRVDVYRFVVEALGVSETSVTYETAHHHIQEDSGLNTAEFSWRDWNKPRKPRCDEMSL